jgi:hypothetical protein
MKERTKYLRPGANLMRGRVGIEVKWPTGIEGKARRTTVKSAPWYEWMGYDAMYCGAVVWDL